MCRASVLVMALSLAACSKPPAPAAPQQKAQAAPQPAPAAAAPPKQQQPTRPPRTMEIYETREVESSSAGAVCRKFKGRCFLLLSEAPLMTIDNFAFEITEQRTVVITLSAAEAEKLAQITRGMATHKGPARRLALLYGGRVLHVPKVRSEIKTDKIRISFCDKTILDNFRGLNPKP